MILIAKAGLSSEIHIEMVGTLFSHGSYVIFSPNNYCAGP